MIYVFNIQTQYKKKCKLNILNSQINIKKSI